MATRTLYPSIAPSLDLNFAGSKTLDPRITFSRASAATYYDGKTVAKAEENLFTYSQDFGTGWTKTAVAVTENTVLAPDGTNTADKVIADTTSGYHAVRKSFSYTAGNTYTISVYAKSAEFSKLVISDLFSTTMAAVYDLTLLTATKYADGLTFTGVSATIVDVGGGWRRCTLTGTANSTADRTPSIAGYPDSGATVNASGTFYTGDNTSGIYLWGAQIEQRSQVTAYTPTTTQPITNYIPVLQTALAGVPRFDHNPVTGESLGLLVEEQRTNLLIYSEGFSTNFWTKNGLSVTSTTVAPDGTSTASRLTEDTISSAKSVARTASVVQDTTYTQSVYAKYAGRHLQLAGSSGFSTGIWANFDLVSGTVGSTSGDVSASIQSVGNGWYRCSIKATATSTMTGQIAIFTVNSTSASRGALYQGDGYSGIYIWGAQLEAGSFPTSYIKTEASQVTRAADNQSMIGANFSSWYRQDEGTVLANASSFSNLSVNYIANANDGTVTNRLALYFTATNPRSLGTANSVSSFQFTGQPATKSCKTGFAYAVNNFAMSTDGSTPQTDTEGAVPTVNQLNIGTQAGVVHLNGHIRRLTYYPKRLTDAQLQALTL